MGHITIQDTDVKEYIPENRSKEAFDLACEISNMTLKEHGYNENYEYDERLDKGE